MKNKFGSKLSGMKDDVFCIKKEDIVPSGWNPRTKADKDEFARLKESIEALGIRIPLIVRPREKMGHPLVAGERRWKASKAGAMLPCIVQTGDVLDAKLTTLIENFVRENVSNEDHERFINDIFVDGLDKPDGWKNHKDMAKKTGLPEWLIKSCLAAFEARKELGLSPEVSQNISTADLGESGIIKDMKVKKRLLEKRAEDKQKTGQDSTIMRGEGHIVHHTSRKLSKVPQKVALDYLNGEVSSELLDVAVQAKEMGKSDQDVIDVVQHVSSEVGIAGSMLDATKRGSAIRAKGILIDDIPEKLLILSGTAEERELSKYRAAVELTRRMNSYKLDHLKDAKLKSEAIHALQFMVKTHTGILLKLGQGIPYVTLEKGKIVDHESEAEQP